MATVVGGELGLLEALELSSCEFSPRSRPRPQLYLVVNSMVRRERGMTRQDIMNAAKSAVCYGFHSRKEAKCARCNGPEGNILGLELKFVKEDEKLESYAFTIVPFCTAPRTHARESELIIELDFAGLRYATAPFKIKNLKTNNPKHSVCSNSSQSLTSKSFQGDVAPVFDAATICSKALGVIPLVVRVFSTSHMAEMKAVIKSMALEIVQTLGGSCSICAVGTLHSQTPPLPPSSPPSPSSTTNAETTPPTTNTAPAGSSEAPATSCVMLTRYSSIIAAKQAMSLCESVLKALNAFQPTPKLCCIATFTTW